MQTVVKKLSDLTRNPKNIRKHSKKQIDEYIRSVNMFGQTRPMVIDENGLILAGNGLYDALTIMGWEECDCYIMKGLSTTEKDKLMLADNKVFELGITDLSSIEDVVRGLGDDLDVPGYDDEVLELITATVAEATTMVMDYGKIDKAEQPVSAPNISDYGQTASQSPQEYPSAEISHDPQPTAVSVDKDSSEHFIICPHCGEKICL